MSTIRKTLGEHPFFRTLRPEHLDLLEHCAYEKEFPRGEILFRQDDCACNFILIEKGKVALETHMPGDGNVLARVLGDGEVLGWSWLFPPYRWHYQARCIDSVKAIVFESAHLLVHCEKDHDFGYELMKRVSQLLIHRFEAARKQALQYREDDPAVAPKTQESVAECCVAPMT